MLIGSNPLIYGTTRANFAIVAEIVHQLSTWIQVASLRAYFSIIQIHDYYVYDYFGGERYPNEMNDRETIFAFRAHC